MIGISTQAIIAFIFGLSFLVALIIMAVKFPNPTEFQYKVFRTVLALSAAGIAAMLPGFIDIQIDKTAELLIRAGGALAVFVIVYFFNPAKLVARK